MSAAIVIGVSAFVMIMNLINALRTIYTLIIFAWAIFSWFDHSKGALRDIYAVLDKLAGPLVKPIKKTMPSMGGIDFSPLIAIIIVQLITQILLWALQFFFSAY